MYSLSYYFYLGSNFSQCFSRCNFRPSSSASFQTWESIEVICSCFNDKRKELIYNHHFCLFVFICCFVCLFLNYIGECLYFLHYCLTHVLLSWRKILSLYCHTVLRRPTDISKSNTEFEIKTFYSTV